MYSLSRPVTLRHGPVAVAWRRLRTAYSPPVDLPVYLDHHATTPCDPRVLAEMTPYFTREFGNPASRTHPFGWRAAEAVETARGRVAVSIGATPRELIFTSGATEANNLALLGGVRARRGRGDHVITCATEHRAVLDPLQVLERDGLRVDRLRVDSNGRIDVAALEAALRPETLLVSVQLANSEIGTLQPLQEIARAVRAAGPGVLLHTDAAQAVGRIPVDLRQLDVDLLSLSGHKLYGPKGIGALFVRRRSPRVELEPLQYGGGHESGLRSGTVAVPLCVGLGAACALVCEGLAAEGERLRDLRERLWSALAADLVGIRLNGDPVRRLPGNLNVSFQGIEADALIASLPELAISTGSACSSARPEPSHVLRALGLSKSRALGSVRFGLGRGTTEAEIDLAARRTIAEVRRLRADS